MMKDTSCKFMLNAELLCLSIEEYVAWELPKAPHALIVGGTGSGKTYACKLMLAKLIDLDENIELFIVDYKHDDDFNYLDGKPHYYAYQDSTKGINEFYEMFKVRLEEKNSSKNLLVLYIDEFASLVSNLDKKEADKIKSIIATILMLGRSYNTFLILSQQRADASYFSNGSRDNFNLIVGLGNLSEESKTMLFKEYKENMHSLYRKGEGYCLLNGSKFQRILIPRIHLMENVNQRIAEALSCP